MRLIAAGIATLVLTVAACGGDDSETDVPDRSRFLAAIDPDNNNAHSLLSYGESMCEAFDEADTGYTAAAFIDNDDHPRTAVRVMLYAVRYLCPRHQDDVEGLVDTLSE